MAVLLSTAMPIVDHAHEILDRCTRVAPCRDVVEPADSSVPELQSQRRGGMALSLNAGFVTTRTGPDRRSQRPIAGHGPDLRLWEDPVDDDANRPRSTSTQPRTRAAEAIGRPVAHDRDASSRPGHDIPRPHIVRVA